MKILRSSSTGLLMVLMIGGCAQQLMPTPNLYVGGDESVFAGLEPALRTNTVDVLFVTDRNLADIKREPRFELGRSRVLRYGSLVVEFGKDVPWPDLVRESCERARSKSLPLARQSIQLAGEFAETPPGSPRTESGPSDDSDRTTTARAVFSKELAKRLALSPEHRNAVVFVHGFDYTLDDSAFIIAELWHFMGRRGVPIAYAWPAQRNYGYARESAEFTIFHFKEFLRSLAACPDVQKVQILAHSLGAEIVLTALRELNIEETAAGKVTRRELKLADVVLAAPDLDLEVASQRISAEGLYSVPERMTIYISSADRALALLTSMFKSRDRLGAVGPEELRKATHRSLIDFGPAHVIHVGVPRSGVGHSYFHSDPAVSSDIIKLLRDGSDPGGENGRPLLRRDDGIWEIGRNYLLREPSAAIR